MKKRKISLPYDLSPENHSRLKAVLIDLSKTIGIFLVTIVLSEILNFYNFDRQAILMINMLSVLIISRITFGYVYGIQATVLSSFAYDYLITAPRMGFSFTIGFPITLCVMLIVAFITSTSTIQMKRQAKLAMEREQRTLLLYEINQKLLAARDLKSIIKITSEYLIAHIHRSVIFYTKEPSLPEAGVFTRYCSESADEALFGSRAELEAAGKIYADFSAENVESHSGSTVYYAPIVSKEKILGLIGVSCVKGSLTQQGILFIQMLAAQVALALELQYLSDEQNKILIEAEREKTRATLLRAISHDLRTPLTSILGASTTVLEQRGVLDEETANKLISDIKINAKWLIRIVENLLSVTKISQDVVKLKKTLEAAEEVVAQSVSIIRKSYPDWQIHIRGPEELLLVPMEATLISQVIINLLENSVNNSKDGSLILVDIKKHGDCAEFSVSDTGRGIPEQMLDNLFETHISETDKSVDSAQRMGIGLSICKTIIHAHGGTITGRNKREGGAFFSFSLPLTEGKGGRR